MQRFITTTTIALALLAGSAQAEPSKDALPGPVLPPCCKMSEECSQLFDAKKLLADAKASVLAIRTDPDPTVRKIPTTETESAIEVLKFMVEDAEIRCSDSISSPH